MQVYNVKQPRQEEEEDDKRSVHAIISRSHPQWHVFKETGLLKARFGQPVTEKETKQWLRMVVVAAFSSPARILRKGSMNHSPPTAFFVVVF